MKYAENLGNTLENVTLIREIALNYRAPKKYKASAAITQPEQAAKLFRVIMPDNSREHFMAIYLDGAHQPIAYRIVFSGTANACAVHPREIFQPALLVGACAIIVGHNHPSGKATPSKEDREVTDRLVETGKLVGIRCIDHVIVTGTDHASLC